MPHWCSSGFRKPLIKIQGVYKLPMLGADFNMLRLLYRQMGIRAGAFSLPKVNLCFSSRFLEEWLKKYWKSELCHKKYGKSLWKMWAEFCGNVQWVVLKYKMYGLLLTVLPNSGCKSEATVYANG